MSDFTRIILRQGTEGERRKTVYSEGEPLYTTDFKRLFIGDGANLGGTLVSNKFLGFARFDLSTNATGIFSAYPGDIVYDLTTDNLYALTGINPLNYSSYTRITRNFAADNVTTVISQTSSIAVKTASLDANYLRNETFGRGVEKNPSITYQIRLTEPSSELFFNAENRLAISQYGVTNDMLEQMNGNHIKGNLGPFGNVEDIPLQVLADALVPLLNTSQQVFGVPIGTIIDFAGPIPPNGYLLCDGRPVSAVQYPELYSVIANTWGGDEKLFNLPDLRRKTTMGSGGIPTTTIDSYVGSVGGTENTILQRSNIPSHRHLFDGVTNGGTLSFTASAGNLRFTNASTEDGTVDGLNEGPLGEPFNIIQPTAVVSKCIRAF